MKIIEQRVFEGKNIYSHKKCIRLDVDLCGYSEIPSKDIPNFNKRLVDYIPELKTHRCGIDEEGGFVIRLKEGTYLAHICEHIIIAIQNKLGIEVAYGKAREIEGDRYYIIFQYEYKATAIETARLAIDIINALINQEEINYVNRIKILKDVLSKEIIGPSTKAIKEAAENHGLPVFELGESGIYQIGYGKSGRVIEATIGAGTSCVATDIASDKLLTKELLRQQGVPVANGEKICNILSVLRNAEKVGYPLVLKPRYGSKGEGVLLNIKNENQLLKAYNNLRHKYEDIMLEEYITGEDYRVCVVDYKVVAASKRTPPFIVGDGINSIRTLIQKLNEDPLRGYDHEKPLTKIKIDEEMLECIKEYGMNIMSIPKKDKKVFLRRNANLSTGGMAIDYTDEICDYNKEICVRAAKAIGLDICGVDIKANNLSKPINEQKGVVMEVNAAPGIRMHIYPSEGQKRDVGEAILNLQYKGKPNNIPVISVTGTNGKTTTTRVISHVLNCMGYNVGMTSTDGIYINNECIDKGDDTGYYSAKTVLLNKDVEVAVLETARGGLIKRGLAYDLADVAVITNITEDHLGLDEVDSMEQLAFVKSLVGEAVKEDGYVVINAEDPWSLTILERIKANKIFFAMSKDNKLIQQNINAGKIAVYLDNNYICVSNNYKEYRVANIDDIPMTLDGILEFNIMNAMSACAALVGMGIDYCMICSGLKSFKCDSKCNSGRFNMYNLNGINVILDYGHNIEGYKNVLNSVSKMKKRNIVGVIGVPGDRSDEMMKNIGNISARVMDKVYIKEDKDTRGRKVGEVADIIRDGVDNKNSGKIEIVLDEVEAFKLAFNECNEGDILIIFYEKIEPLLEVLKQYELEQKKLNLANL